MKTKIKVGFEPFTPLETLGLSARTLNPLLRAGLESVEELEEYPPAFFWNIRGFGDKAYAELVVKMKKVGLFPRNDE